MTATIHTTRPPLTVEEAAAWLSVHPATLARWRSVGAGPAYYRVGVGVRYRIEDLEIWVKNTRVEPIERQVGGA